MTTPTHDQRAESDLGRRPVSRSAADSTDVSLRVRPGSRSPASSAAVVRRLQSAAGNRAVAALIAQRRADSARGPAAVPDHSGGSTTPGLAEPPLAEPGPTATDPAPVAAQRSAAPAAADPEGEVVQRLAESGGGRKLAALTAEVRGKQKLMSAHQPPAVAAGAAQKAAKPPQDDKQAQGKAANAEKMNAAKPGEFDKVAFIQAVDKAIAAQAPKNLDEADTFSKSGKADAVKGQVQGRVVDGKKQSAGQIESTTMAPPDTAAAREKPVTPLKPGQPAPIPTAPDTANAVPDKAPASATDFSAGPAQVNQQMAQAQVTEEQLAKSNEPEFTDALKEKKTGEQHAQTAPAQIRGEEAKTLAATKAHAMQQGAAAMQQMAAVNKTATAAVASGQHGAQGSDEAKRTQVTGVLLKVFDATQKHVEQILSGLDKKVDDAFTTGEKKTRDAFTADHKRRMDAYKDKRYSGLLGKARWVKDKFTGLPEEANQIFAVARQGYVTGMRQVISNVADIIGGELTRAKQRITTGRNQLRAEVAKLPRDLQAIGKQAAGEFTDKFDELTSSVDAKGTELVDTLAARYTEALKSVDAEINAEKQKNKGLIAKAMDAVGGVIKTIMQLKDLLLGVLAKAASAVAAILKDPIGFLGHLVSAVGAGLRNFINNIGTHLQKGLIGWLLGTMTSAGLQIPAKFDLRGILGMIASLLGLTWAAIRGRIVAKGIPEKAMSTVEAGVPLVGKLQNEGVAGVTEEIREQVGDLKTNLLGKISEYLIPTVLTAGITWIISLLNPASAFIKACKMIIDIVTFIIDRGAQITEFVNSVLDAIIAIATGGTGGVPALIEKALAKSIPVLIGALAAILGIGGIADKIKKFFQALSKPVMKAVDWIVGKIVKLGKAMWTKLKKTLGKEKDKDKDGPDRGRDHDGAKGKSSDGKDQEQAPQIKAPRKRFDDARDERHELYFPKDDPRAPLMVHSTPELLDVHLSEWDDQIKALEDEALEDPDFKEQRKAWERAHDLAEEIERDTAAIPASGTGRQKAHNRLIRKMEKLARELASRRSLAEPPLPPPIYPPFRNDVLAGSFKASYINKDSGDNGEQSDQHKGPGPKGWDVVVNGRYNETPTGEKTNEWVRMHLLPDSLGGKATDSNLVPARGYINNPIFHWEIENPAATALEKSASDPRHETMIWYKVRVSYHSTHRGFPSKIEVAWGGYKPSGGQWKPKPTSMSLSDPQDPPEHPMLDVLRINRATATLIKRHLGCAEDEAKAIKKAVKRKQFADISDLAVRFPKLTTEIYALERQQRLKFY